MKAKQPSKHFPDGFHEEHTKGSDKENEDCDYKVP
jgi:hypothetical protein